MDLGRKDLNWMQRTVVTSGKTWSSSSSVLERGENSENIHLINGGLHKKRKYPTLKQDDILAQYLIFFVHAKRVPSFERQWVECLAVYQAITSESNIKYQIKRHCAIDLCAWKSPKLSIFETNLTF